MRPYRYMRIKFVDGTAERVGGDQMFVHNGVLTVSTSQSYGGDRDVHNYVLSNVKSYGWEG